MAPLIDRITKSVKKKKEFASIDDTFVKRIIERELNKKLRETLEKHDEKTLERSEKFKKVVKSVRAVLRKKYGVFKKEYKNDDDFLKKHLSTRERLPFYQEVYQKIWGITGKPKSILDLGCGYNPFSFKFMKLKKVKYFAVELTKEDCKDIQQFFDKTKEINGKAMQMDLENKENFKKLPKADITFMFKLLDTIDRKKGHALSKELIDNIKSKWIVISFATKTIGQRTMKRKTYRGKWLETYLTRKNKRYEKFEIPNEIFYVIENEN